MSLPHKITIDDNYIIEDLDNDEYNRTIVIEAKSVDTGGEVRITIPYLYIKKIINGLVESI